MTGRWPVIQESDLAAALFLAFGQLASYARMSQSLLFVVKPSMADTNLNKPPIDAQALQVLIEKIEADNDCDVFLFAGPVTIGAEREFNGWLRRSKTRKNLLCLTTTHGGSADVAYQIVKAIRRQYPDGRFLLYVDTICKSAGTLIAVGADEIVMSDTAELGPLDVQLQKPGELGEYHSGLTTSQALATLKDALFESFESHFLNLRFRSQGQITTRMAAEMAVEMAVGSFRPIYGQFDPMRIGDNERSCLIAQEYGDRIRTDNLKTDALLRLIREYPSHAFVIDRDEAGELFENVRCPTEDELLLAEIFRSSSGQALYADSPVIRPIKIEGEPDDNCNKSEQNDSIDSPKGPSETKGDAPEVAKGDRGQEHKAESGSPG